MDIRQLETFVWIARLGSMTEACKRLNVTQSTLSMRLRALETDLRVTLFNRSHKQLTLTAKGRDLIGYAEKIVAIVQQVRLHIADPASESGTIRIGMSEFVALSWGPQLVRRVSKEFPNVALDLEVGVPGELLDLLVADQLDVLFAPVLVEPAASSINISSLGTVRYSWMASPSLGLPKNIVTPTELTEFPILSYDGRHSRLFPAVRRWFSDHGAEIQRLYICNSLATSIAMIIEGIAIGVLPLQYCEPRVKAGELQVLKTHYLVDHEYFAMWRTKDDKSLPSVVASMAHSVFAEAQMQVESEP